MSCSGSTPGVPRAGRGDRRHAATCREHLPSRAAAPSAAPSAARLLLLLLGLLQLPTASADLGVYSDSEDQRLTVRIAPLPTDSGFPYALYRQVQLRCVIDTEPAIDIGSSGWRFNDGASLLENTNKYTLYVRPSRGTVHSLTMVLTINGVTPRQLGDYTCEGQNSAGLRRSATVVLELIDDDTVGIRDALYEDTTQLNDDAISEMGTDDVKIQETTRSADVTTDVYASSATSLVYGRCLSYLSAMLCSSVTLYLLIGQPEG